MTTAGYYDYQAIAKDVSSIVGRSDRLIELGVGTGLLAEKYIEIEPTCEFTGVDFTASMLEIAKKRLGNRAKLLEADVVTMALNATFDVAISNGGGIVYSQFLEEGENTNDYYTLQKSYFFKKNG